MRICLLSLMAVGLLSGGALAQTGNLLGNPSFEIDQFVTWGTGWGDFPGNQGIWARESASSVTAQNGISPLSGVRMLRMNQNFGSVSQVMQPVDVSAGLAQTLIGQGTARASFQAYFNVQAHTAPPVLAYVGVHFFAGNTVSTQIGTQSYTELRCDTNPGTWQLSVHDVAVPIAAQWIVVELMFSNASLNGIGRGYVDDASLVIYPGPGCTTFCDGGGGGTQCPCANHNDGSAPDGLASGCKNSRPNFTGAMLRCSGFPSTLMGPPSGGGLGLVASNGPSLQPILFFQGVHQTNGGNGHSFGDGLRCAGGSIRRLQIRIFDHSGLAETTVDIAAQGQVVPGSTYYYQGWYRDPGGPCGVGLNFTNGVAVLWGP